MSDLDKFGQFAQIDEQLDDIERVVDRKNAARLLMQRQVESDDIKSSLCDKLRYEKLSVYGLDKKVKALEHSDPDLFNYIHKLELVQYGVWCSKCQQIKNIGVMPEEPTVIVVPDKIEILNARHQELHDRIKALSQSAQIKLDKLSEYSKQIDNDIKQIATPNCVKINNPIKKETTVIEQLPPKPTFNFDTMINEKFKAIELSADDLLG